MQLSLKMGSIHAKPFIRNSYQCGLLRNPFSRQLSVKEMFVVVP